MSGPLPSMALVRKIAVTVIAAVAWFLPGHLAVAALLVLVWGSAMASTANTAKARSTETRLAAHIVATAPAINFVANGGSVGGSVTVNGSHTVTGNMGVQGGTTLVGSSSCSNNFTVGGSHTVNGNMGVQGGTTLVGSSSCSNDFTTGGNATVNGSHTVYGAIGVHGSANLTGGAGVSGGLTTDSISTSGTSTVYGSEGVHSNLTVLGSINGANIPSSPPGSAPAPPSGGTVSYYAGNFYNPSGALTWAQGVSDSVDQIISALENAGIFN